MKKIVILLYIFIILGSVFAEPLVLPDSYRLETQEDFDYYEEKIIDCINWYVTAPLDAEPEFRQNLKTFVLIWLTENPSIKINMNTDVLEPVLKDEDYQFNPEIVFSYLCGMAKYAILNTEEEYDPVEEQYSGILSALFMLQNNMTILYGSRGLETYLLLENTEELRNWIANALEKSEG